MNPTRSLQRYRLLRDLCRQNGLALSPRENWDSVPVLAAIFRERTYALGFPFYERARVLDVGAHKGYFVLFALQHLAPGSLIHAYEPVPENLRTLRSNAARNGGGLQGSGGVTLEAFGQAVAATGGRGVIRRAASFNHRVERVRTAADDAAPPGGDVEVVSLESALDRLPGGEADFVKMDCEGGEYDILLGSPPSVIRRAATYAVEFHDTRTAEQSGQRLRERFERRGFRVLRFEYAPTTQNLNYGLLVATRAVGQASAE